MKKYTMALLAMVSVLASASEPQYLLGYDVAQKASILDAKNNNIKNSLTSPLSLHLALSMAAAGAEGKTLTQLLGKLGAKDRAALLAANASLSKLLNKKPVGDDWPSWQPRPPVLSIANSAWRTTGATDKRRFAFSQAFKNDLADVQFGEGDFHTQKAVDDINAWVTQATNNMITKIIGLDGLKPLLWVLINAIYLEGQWEKPLIPLTTRGPNFTGLNNSKIKAEMMTTTAELKHVVTSDGEAVELPLASSDLSFVALLPTEGRLTGDASAQFSEAVWSDVLARLASAEEERGTLEIPKFKYSYGYEMDEPAQLTKDIGLSPIFSNEADFSRMGTRDSVPSKVGLIVQKTAIELDEKGLKAAAVTLVGGMERTSVPAKPTFHMQINRPFVYSIVDRKTGAVLFLGAVYDPTKN